ncbi:hypothetical protein KBY67_04325 [Synechococcus sp. RedBA-s]|nr:hypothetical protein [Synechococcus sp. RedBA-s]
MDDTSRGDELRALRWSAKDVDRYEELWEYRRRWGAICIESDEREFLRRADEALAKRLSSKSSFGKVALDTPKHRSDFFLLVLPQSGLLSDRPS